jgi:hypothetical protein
MTGVAAPEGGTASEAQPAQPAPEPENNQRSREVVREAKMLGLHDEADQRAYGIIDKLVDGPDEPTPAPEPQAESVPDVEPETTEDDEAETVDAPEESAPETDATENQPPLPDSFTVEDLAQAYEVDPAELTDKLQVRVGDKMVTLAEAIKGNLRESDYSQKSMALAEDRSSFEDEQGMIRGHLAQQLEQAEQALQVANELYPNTDMSHYAHMLDENSESYDPAQYLRIEQQNSAVQARIAQIQEVVQAQRAQANAEYQQELANWRTQQVEQLKVLKPELQDTAKAQEIEKSWQTYLHEEAGFTVEEVAQYFGGPFNAKHMMLVDKAMRYDAMEKGKGEIAKKLAAKPRVMRPGATTNQGDAKANQLRKARQRLRNTGSDDAALDIIDSLV